MKPDLFVRTVSVFCACFLLLLCVDCFVPGNESEIYEGAVRLHVLASSDSSEDQSLKLKVRDAILKEYGSCFLQSDDPKKAREAVEQNIQNIKNTADAVLKSCGAEYRSRVLWGKEIYPTRVYEEVTLPAGEYYSLRVELGEAEGKNWWCVLFPPLCNGASTKKLTLSGVDDNSAKVFTQKKYTFRFKLLELFGW